MSNHCWSRISKHKALSSERMLKWGRAPCLTKLQRLIPLGRTLQKILSIILVGSKPLSYSNFKHSKHQHKNWQNQITIGLNHLNLHLDPHNMPSRFMVNNSSAQTLIYTMSPLLKAINLYLRKEPNLHWQQGVNTDLQSNYWTWNKRHSPLKDTIRIMIASLKLIMLSLNERHQVMSCRISVINILTSIRKSSKAVHSRKEWNLTSVRDSPRNTI